MDLKTRIAIFAYLKNLKAPAQTHFLKHYQMEKVHQCTVQHIKAEKELLEKHSVKMAKHLQSNEGIWLSTYWFTFFVIIQFIFCLAVGIWAWLK